MQRPQFIPHGEIRFASNACGRIFSLGFTFSTSDSKLFLLRPKLESL